MYNVKPKSHKPTQVRCQDVSNVMSSPLRHENFGKEASELLQDGNFNNMAEESKHRHQDVACTADDTDARLRMRFCNIGFKSQRHE